MEEMVKYSLDFLKKHGIEKSYRVLLGSSIIKKILESQDADEQMLDVSKYFFSLYRRSGDERYFDLGKIYRRVAHTLHRKLLKLDNNKKSNDKFIRMVR